MFKRLSIFLYGVVSYAIFFGTYLYAVGFVGNFGVPRTLDGSARGMCAAQYALSARTGGRRASGFAIIGGSSTIRCCRFEHNVSSMGSDTRFLDRRQQFCSDRQ